MNQREIKFEIAIKNKESGRILKPILTIGELTDRNGCLYSPEIHEVLYKRQFIGIKDKDGKEIYEGDIVFARAILKGEPSDIIRFNAEIIFNPSKASYQISFNNGFRAFMHDIASSSYEIQVVGNIFEHQHLLEHSTFPTA